MVNLGIFLGFFLPCSNSLAYSNSSSIHSLWERKPVRDSPRSERSVSIMRSGFSLPASVRYRKNGRDRVAKVNVKT